MSWYTADINTKQYTLDYLIPGETYNIEVEDCNGETASTTITVPAIGDFEDGKLTTASIKTKIEPKYKNNSSDGDKASKDLKAFSASDIMNANGKEYGFQYTVDYPVLAKSRFYDTLIAIEAPNGFVDTFYMGNIEYTRYNSATGRLWWYFMGKGFFNSLQRATDTVPTGEYIITLYWDGMFVNRNSIRVQ